ARKALQNPTPAATVVRDRRKLLLFYPPNLQTKNLHLFARGRTARTLARRAIGFVSVGRIFRRRFLLRLRGLHRRSSRHHAGLVAGHSLDLPQLASPDEYLRRLVRQLEFFAWPVLAELLGNGGHFHAHLMGKGRPEGRPCVALAGRRESVDPLHRTISALRPPDRAFGQKRPRVRLEHV